MEYSNVQILKSLFLFFTFSFIRREHQYVIFQSANKNSNWYGHSFRLHGFCRRNEAVCVTEVYLDGYGRRLGSCLVDTSEQAENALDPHLFLG